jgi:hypothetical protein
MQITNETTDYTKLVKTQKDSLGRLSDVTHSHILPSFFIIVIDFLFIFN